MKNFLQVIIAFTPLFFFHSLHAQQAPAIEWQKCLGGSDVDVAYSVLQTTDGGYVVAGTTYSNDSNVSGNHGLTDYWIVKLDSVGNLVWQKSIGGSMYECALSIQQTTDGGFIVAGWTYSNDGDVSGNHLFYGWPTADCWIVKLDTAGNIAWQKCLGGSGGDQSNFIQQTTDGGFIVAGYSDSNDGDVSGWHQGYTYFGNPYTDYWIVKLDAVGSIMWQKCLGGGDEEGAKSIEQTTDGGFIIAGYTKSSYASGDVSGPHGNNDYWIVKLDATGNLAWEECLGGHKSDIATAIQQTTDGGFVVAGYSFSDDGNVSGHHGDTFYSDWWIVKLDTAGNLVWQRSLGGSYDDVAESIEQTTDGGFIVAGGSGSDDGDVSGNHGADDWIVKLDTAGNLVWQKCFGGNGVEEAYSVQQTSDGGFIIAGGSSSNDGDVSGNHGNGDYWIVKLYPEIPTDIPSLVTNSISLYPNPVKNLLTINLASSTADACIHVYDLQGRMISLPITLITTTQVQLNTSALPDGFYTVQITSKKTGMSEVGKFVKQY